MKPSEKAALGMALEELEKPKARERMEAGKAPYGKIPQGRSGPVRDIVGSAPVPIKNPNGRLGVSGRTYKRAKTVVQAAHEETVTTGNTPSPHALLSPYVRRRRAKHA